MANQHLQVASVDIINTKATQLDALLNSMYGECFSGFMCLNDEIKESLIHLASDLVSDIRRALEAEVSHG